MNEKTIEAVSPTIESPALETHEAPGMVPLANEQEFLPVTLTVQTPEENGAEDKALAAA